MKMNRRTFLTGAAAAGTALVLPQARPAEAAISDDSYASLIDLAKCDGCAGKKVPDCVTACGKGNESRFPRPEPEQLRDYWPQKKHEDWSKKKHLKTRFTPYNWLFVQNVEVNGQKLSIPRRCMHCDNPPCAKLCPFGVKHKTAEGPVYIDTHMCFGGAKCRTVCPWSVPQRQAGVGLYTNWQKVLPVGGGVMYKCDLCRNRLAEDKKPFCMESCPKGAMKIGKRVEIFAEAQKLKKQYNGHLYGMKENGGTSTVYVSRVPFEQINKAILATKSSKNKKPTPMHKPENMLDKQTIWSKASLAAPAVGALAAFFAAGSKAEKEGDK